MTDVAALTDAEAALAARHETLSHHAGRSGDVGVLERLHAEAAADLGPDSRMALLAECGLEETRSASRPLVESVRVWDGLWERAVEALPRDDPVRRSIGQFRARYRRRCGRAADLEAGVEEYRREWMERCRSLGVDNYATRVMHANLALAVRDRDQDGDLAEALRMLREEVGHRVAAYGGNSPFTWIARAILAQTLVRSAERAADPGVRELHAAEAEQIAGLLVDGRRMRFGMADISTLRAQLVHANALILLGRAVEAVPEIRHVRTIARWERVPLEPGWAEGLLARAEADAGDLGEAVRWAEEARRRKAAYYPPESRHIAASERLAAELRARC